MPHIALTIKFGQIWIFKKSCNIALIFVGGVWVYSDELRPGQGSAMYDCLVTNSSKAMMAFSDYPIPKDHPPYLSYKNVLKYVQDYARLVIH